MNAEGSDEEGKQTEKQETEILHDQRRGSISAYLLGPEIMLVHTGIGKKAWLFAKLQPGRARKRINAT